MSEQAQNAGGFSRTMEREHDHGTTMREGYVTNMWPEPQPEAPPDSLTRAQMFDRRPVPINPTPTNFRHALDESSPEMKQIMAISEMNLQRIDHRRRGLPRNTPVTLSTRWHTNTNNEPYQYAETSRFATFSRPPVDHSVDRERHAQEARARNEQFTGGQAQARYFNSVTGTYSLTRDGPPVAYGERMQLNARQPPPPVRIRTEAPMTNFLYHDNPADPDMLRRRLEFLQSVDPGHEGDGIDSSTIF